MRPIVTASTMIALSLLGGTARAAEHIVCTVAAASCDFTGNRALQDAVDRAANGDNILIRSGTYVSEGFRDVQYDDVVVRGFVLIEDKDLVINGENGAVLDGRDGSRTSAIVIVGGEVTINNLVIREFGPESADDDIYDGHGVFVIDASARLSRASFEGIRKMAVSLRGSSTVILEDSRLVDGHVGAWLEEEARLFVRNSLFFNNDSAGIAAYASSNVTVDGSTFDANLDDGVYAAENATIDVTESVFIRNRPYAVRNVDNAQIRITSSKFRDNAEDRYAPSERDSASREKTDDQGL